MSVLDRLNNKPGSQLEIGCGWGGFADHVLDSGAYDITGITLSREQHDFARGRLAPKVRVNCIAPSLSRTG